MPTHDDIRLRHMLDSALETVSFAYDKSRKDLDIDRKLMLAIIKSIEIILEGEPLHYPNFLPSYAS